MCQIAVKTNSSIFLDSNYGMNTTTAMNFQLSCQMTGCDDVMTIRCNLQQMTLNVTSFFIYLSRLLH